jgi:hypothetical protein
MTANEIRTFLNTAIGQWTRDIKTNPLSAATRLNVTNLFLMSEIACHLSDMNASLRPVRFTCNNVPIWIRPCDVQRIVPERLPAPNQMERVTKILTAQGPLAVDQSADEAAAMLGFFPPSPVIPLESEPAHEAN